MCIRDRTKTISGDLISKKITNNQEKKSKKQKRLWRCLRVEYLYTSALNGPCNRHKVCMLRTANNEYFSLSTLCDVCTAAVVPVLTIISYRAWSKLEKKAKDRRKTKS